MSVKLKEIIWMTLHPIQTFIIFTCQHYDIDLDSLKCKKCNKQYRYINASEYVGLISDRKDAK